MSDDVTPQRRGFTTKQKWLIGGSVGFVLLLLVGVLGGSDDEPSATASPNAAALADQPSAPPTALPAAGPTATARAITAAPTAAPRARSQPAPINLSGTGKQATQEFSLIGDGITVFRMTHRGDANWAPTLLHAGTGEREELLANDIGPFNGSKLVAADADSYVLDVEANGPWTITVEQPRPAAAPAIPQTPSGPSQGVGGPVTLPRGLVRFAMKHSGDANFAPILYADDGDRIELLANDIGPFDGSKAVTIPRAGIYWIDVAANGNWSIAISQ